MFVEFSALPHVLPNILVDGFMRDAGQLFLAHDTGYLFRAVLHFQIAVYLLAQVLGEADMFGFFPLALLCQDLGLISSILPTQGAAIAPEFPGDTGLVPAHYAGDVGNGISFSVEQRNSVPLFLVDVGHKQRVWGDRGAN